MNSTLQSWLDAQIQALKDLYKLLAADLYACETPPLRDLVTATSPRWIVGPPHPSLRGLPSNRPLPAPSLVRSLRSQGMGSASAIEGGIASDR